MRKILAINTGSTSTKVGYFENEHCLKSISFSHSNKELSQYKSVLDQRKYREGIILEWLESQDIHLENLDAVACRGGIIKPVSSGTYRVNEKMLRDLHEAKEGTHASNLSAIIGHSLANRVGVEAYITDPVVVFEYQPEAVISGHPQFVRKSITHALNQKAVGRKAAQLLGKAYKDCRFVIAHVGGGISVANHYYGKMIDGNHATDGGGPFSPERSGTLPIGDVVRYCFESGKTKDEIVAMIHGNGGVRAYLGESDMRIVEKQMEEGDEKAALIFSTMAYQTAKEIGALSVAGLKPPELIIITGGVAHSKKFVELVKKRVEFIAPVKVFPGESEMDALALGTLRVLNGEERVKTY